MGSRRLLVVDANVLIDYASTDVAILALAARHLGAVHIPYPILEEVAQLDVADCDRLGLSVVEASVAQLLEAGTGRGRLSFNDRVCLVIARDAGWTCVTNDKALRSACGELSVPVLWGLELMVDLVALGELTASAALQVAKAIHLANPQHITSAILERFAQRIGVP